MRTLTHDGRNLVVPFAAVERRPGYRGAKLVPSPNRMADGAYTFKGHNEQLGINETDRMTALHGLVLWNEWKLPEQASAGVVLGTVIEPQEADPWISGRWSCRPHRCWVSPPTGCCPPRLAPARDTAEKEGGEDVEMRLHSVEGTGVLMRWNPAVLPWVQIHTADRPEPKLHRIGLAVEPMSCPPDAFNSGHDLVVHAHGERHDARWLIAAL